MHMQHRHLQMPAHLLAAAGKRLEAARVVWCVSKTQGSAAHAPKPRWRLSSVDDTVEEKGGVEMPWSEGMEATEQ